MNNERLLRVTWIESFILQNKNQEKFSLITNVFTVIVSSILLI